MASRIYFSRGKTIISMAKTFYTHAFLRLKHHYTVAVNRNEVIVRVKSR